MFSSVLTKNKTKPENKTSQKLLVVLEVFTHSETDKTILIGMLPWKIMESQSSLSCWLPSLAMLLSLCCCFSSKKLLVTFLPGRSVRGGEGGNT